MKNWINKIFIALVVAMNVFHLSGVSAADTGANILEALNDTNVDWTTSITTENATATTVDIKFPVFTANNEQIMNYAVSYVKDKSIANADLTDIKKDTFEGEKVKLEGETITLVLEGLTASSTYNFVVTPVNNEGSELEISEEKTFQTTAEGATPNEDPMNEGDEPMLGAADTASANFTYVVDDNKVTMKWQPISGASKFAFSMKEVVDANYTNLDEVDISKGTYTFVIGKKGLFTVKIVPIDAGGNVAGTERTASIKIDNVTATGSGTPATGAGLNLILMSTFLMMLIYVVYRFRTTK